MGKLGAGAAPSVASRDATRGEDDDVVDRHAVAAVVGLRAPSSPPPTSPIAPSTPTRRFESFRRLRMHKKMDASDEGGSSSSSSEFIRGDVADLPPSKTKSSTTTTNAASLPPPDNARELRDHVSQFTARSDWLAALVVAETAAGWLVTAAAPTLFDRFVEKRLRRAAAPSSSSAAALAALAASSLPLLLCATWITLRACSYVRSVILMHDLVHGILFSSRKANSVAASLAGLAAWTSAANFGRNHRRHHARLAVEEEIDFDADHTVFWTVKEWNEWQPGASKVAARVLRDPLVYHFVTAPAYLLFFGSTCPGYGPGLSFSQTLARLLKDHWPRIAGVVGGFSSIAFFGGERRFWLELAAGWTGLIIGASIFALQHDALAPPLRGYRSPLESHSRDAAALRGSTYLAAVPRWLSSRVLLGIEHHHIHHLDARVPCYRLMECHASAPVGAWEAAGVPMLKNWGDILKGLSVALWDEDEGHYVKFPPLLAVKRGQVWEEAWQRAVAVARERLRR